MVTDAGLQRALREAEESQHALQTRLAALGDSYGLRFGPSRVIAELDDDGLVDSLTFTEGGRVDLELLRLDIERTLAGAVPRLTALLPARMEQLVDALLSDDAGVTVTNDLQTVAVTAKQGMIARVEFDHRLLNGARPQSICDEVVPVARRAALASDTAGVFGGAR